MKNITIKSALLALLLLPLCYIATAQIHKFAPIGAEWYYEYQDMYRRGYVHIEAVSDTMFGDVKCTKLVKTIHGYDGFLNQGLFSAPYGNEYVTQSNDSVMIYRYGTFRLLFDFGASVGDTWTVYGSNNICPQSYGTVHVVEVGTDTIAGEVLKYVKVLDDQESSWGYCPIMYPFDEPMIPIKIVERIGPMGSYMLPEQRCVWDESEGGSLRCYIDDDLGYHNFSWDHVNCGYINDQYQSIDNPGEGLPLFVWPNPCSNNIHVVLCNETNSGVCLYDIQGNNVYQSGNIGKSFDIDMSTFNQGLYLLKVYDGLNSSTIKIIKNK